MTKTQQFIESSEFGYGDGVEEVVDQVFADQPAKVRSALYWARRVGTKMAAEALYNTMTMGDTPGEYFDILHSHPGNHDFVKQEFVDYAAEKIKELMSLGEAEHDFDYDLPMVDQDALNSLNHEFKIHAVKDGTYRFQISDERIVGKWKAHTREVVALRIGVYTPHKATYPVFYIELCQKNGAGAWDAIRLLHGSTIGEIASYIMDDPVFCP